MPDKNYLCFEAIKPCKLYFRAHAYNLNVPLNVNLEYSLDDGTNWNTYNIGTWNQYKNYYNLGQILDLTDGQKVYFRGNNPNGFTKVVDYGTSDYCTILCRATDSVKISGNIMSLIDPSCESVTIPNEYCFDSLFDGGVSTYGLEEPLQDGINKIISAPELPAINLKSSCYANMFSSSNIEEAPDLPAIVLVDDCYSYMFYNCAKLWKIPNLPGTTLANGCYSYMFYDCSLVKLSETITEECGTIFKIPSSGAIVSVGDHWGDGMFDETGGTYTGTPVIDAIYYTKPVPPPPYIDKVTLNGAEYAIKDTTANFIISNYISEKWYGTEEEYLALGEHSDEVEYNIVGE